MLAKVLGYIIGVVVLMLILSLLVMWSWNAVIVDVFDMKSISYTQSLCIVVLSQILIKSTTK